MAETMNVAHTDSSDELNSNTPRFTYSVTGIVIAAAIVYVAVAHLPLMGAFLAIMSGLIAWHEGAHLLTARYYGLAVTEFAIGFGPKVVSFRAAGQDWSLRSLPIGGFVKIVGPLETSEVPDGIPESATLRGTTRWRRVATIAAGPLSNLVLALILSTLAFGAVGVKNADGDRDRLGPVAAAEAGFNDAKFATTATLQGLGAIATDVDGYASAVASGDRDEAPAAFLSPVGAAKAVGEFSDPHLLLRFAAIISVGLAVFNFLPFPPLDGGHLAVEAINAIRSRIRRTKSVVSVKALNYASAATLSVFLILTVTALRFDLVG